VYLHNGRFKVRCDTPPCHNNNLGNFVSTMKAAQMYLQHQQESHAHHAATDTWIQCDDCNTWRRFAAAGPHTIPDVAEGERWCCTDSLQYTCALDEEAEQKPPRSHHAAVPGLKKRKKLGMNLTELAAHAAAAKRNETEHAAESDRHHGRRQTSASAASTARFKVVPAASSARDHEEQREPARSKLPKCRGADHTLEESPLQNTQLAESAPDPRADAQLILDAMGDH
jgi:hypothetical protein